VLCQSIEKPQVIPFLGQVLLPANHLIADIPKTSFTWVFPAVQTLGGFFLGNSPRNALGLNPSFKALGVFMVTVTIINVDMKLEETVIIIRR
jgi:hypothetical protein